MDKEHVDNNYITAVNTHRRSYKEGRRMTFLPRWLRLTRSLQPKEAKKSHKEGKLKNRYEQKLLTDADTGKVDKSAGKNFRWGRVLI